MRRLVAPQVVLVPIQQILNGAKKRNALKHWVWGPGEEVTSQPGLGNRNMFFDWKNRAMAEGKVTRSGGKYYRAYPEKETVN